MQSHSQCFSLSHGRRLTHTPLTSILLLGSWNPHPLANDLEYAIQKVTLKKQGWSNCVRNFCIVLGNISKGFDIVARANKRLYFLRVCRKANLPTEVGLTTYISKIRPLRGYASPVWGGLPKYLADDLQRIQNRSMDILGPSRDALDPLDVKRDKHTVPAFNNILEADNYPCMRFIK